MAQVGATGVVGFAMPVTKQATQRSWQGCPPLVVHNTDRALNRATLLIMRGQTEFIISSAIDFSLNDELKMKALVTEVYRLEQFQWKLVRQYMEKYQPTT